MNQIKPDVEEVFSNGSHIGSVNERENLKSLSIMNHFFYAHVVLKTEGEQVSCLVQNCT